MVDFLQQNWGKLSGLALALGHFIVLHRDHIKSAIAWWGDIDGVNGAFEFLRNGNRDSIPSKIASALHSGKLNLASLDLQGDIADLISGKSRFPNPMPPCHPAPEPPQRL
jgi:hypothetical protein